MRAELGQRTPVRLTAVSAVAVERNARQRYMTPADPLAACLAPLGSEARCHATRLNVSRLDELLIIRNHEALQWCAGPDPTLASTLADSILLAADFGRVTQVQWRGLTLTLEPGDLFVGDLRGAPSGCLIPGAICITMPTAWANARMRDATRLCGRKIARDVGWGAALSTFVAQLTPELVSSSPLPAKLLAESLGGLLSLVEGEILEGWPIEDTREHRLCDRIKDTLRQHAMECGLTAQAVAVATNISERTLHRCLARRGETYSQLLLQFRIDCARRMLQARNLDRLTTAEIGRRSGFADPSYFVRAATRHLGMTPRQFRLARRP